MRVGISSAVYYPQLAETAIEKISRAGVSCAEYFYNCDYEISDEFVGRLKNICTEQCLEIISVHPYTAFAEDVYFFSDYERRTEENFKRYAAIFENAKKLGAKFLTLHGERLNKATFSGAHIEAERAIRSLSVLADEAKKKGITLCLENVAWCKSSDIEYLKRVVDNVENIGFTLDLKQARRAGVPYEKHLDIMGDKIRNIHVSDYDAKNDCLLPGKGDFDFASFIERLKKLKYKGDLIIEVYSSNYVEEAELFASKDYLESLI